MDLQTLKFEISEGIATITLARPEKKNPLSLQVFKELDSCLDKASADKSVAAVIITGGNKVFCAGMDIAEMQSLKKEDTFTFWNSGYNLVFEKIYNFRVPTIAAVSGYALAGGFDLAISCDFRIVSETAKFGQLEVDVHLSPGIERLWRLVGLSRAKYLGMTCEIIDAREAYRIGLADKVVKVENLQKEAGALAAKFVKKPREALERTKDSYIKVLGMDHKSAVNWETQLLCRLFDTDERKRIMDKFLNKNK
ncbi:MAG: enoyl-CoA hydratase/isomerase family protein [Dehalococcoidales bacterium]|nr:enoyl-CoA hydratase/isomerase family protein [Dehalococcoidales bacterium]